MGERGIQGNNAAEELEELDLLEELPDGGDDVSAVALRGGATDELAPLEEMLQQGSRVVARPSAPPPPPPAGRTSVPPPFVPSRGSMPPLPSGRSSAPPPVPPEARRSSAPPSIPPTSSGIFAIDKDIAARPEPTDGSVDAELRARALHVDRLRLNVRLRDDRIRELERALQAQSRREQDLERRASDASARADALQQQLDAGQGPHDGGDSERMQQLERELAAEQQRSAERVQALELELAAERHRAVQREQSFAGELDALRSRGDDLERQLNELRTRDSADDLKRIAGIGPAFERALAKLGVTSFAQIAQWSSEEVLRIAGELNVSPRRIERDGWVARARELCGMTQLGMPAPVVPSETASSEPTGS